MICTVQAYRQITHDTDSYDGDVEAALTSAQKLVEQKTDRFFEIDERTERLRIHGTWLVYPHALPLVAVTTPAGALVSNTAVWSAYVDLSAVPGLFWAHGTVTYTGGYEAEDMPEEIVEAVAQIAFAKLPSNASDIPVGASSIHIGDVSVTGKNLGQSSGLPDSVRKTLITWKRREL